MRDIKFRAWNLNANKFDSYAGVINMSLGEAGALWAKNIPMEFQQYTGLTDKSGVEIYEGDIVSVLVERTYKPNNKSGHRAGHKQVLERRDMQKVIKWNDGGFNIKKPKSNTFWFEVIGNIYENKELLERKV